MPKVLENIFYLCITSICARGIVIETLLFVGGGNLHEGGVKFRPLIFARD